jgi:hypothetical protein
MRDLKLLGHHDGYHTVNSVCGDPLRKLLLIVSDHFVMKAKSEPIREAYFTHYLRLAPN